MSSAFNFANAIPHAFEYLDDRYYRIQGIDFRTVGASHLFFARDGQAQHDVDPAGTHLRDGEWLATGTFRNSLYLEPIASLTSIRDLCLLVDYSGAMRLRLYCATLGKPLQVLKDVALFSLERTQHLFDIGSPTDFPENSRLFWHAEPRDGGAVLYDAIYVTNTAPRKDCRLMVLLRTYGRTVDVKSILRRFADAGRKDLFYAALLDNVHFFLLDTTKGCDQEYGEPWQDFLNLEVWVGENLGGGGNAGHMLKLLADRCQNDNQSPTELLLLDDDLSISMESLARYFMLCAYRGQEFICSLPVLMKSRPTVVWEDGGFWGRLNFHEGGSFHKKRNLFPNLLKHGLDLQGFEGLDSFSPLNPCEYSTFIFFGLSLDTFRKLGYPAAFFLRGDDVEYSLRAQRMGIPMFTNPNLAAWHEPAHSYAQEYMAIMHGVIINLTYGEHNAGFFIRFFEERLHEHASIDDLAGLAVYKDILVELVNPESEVLSPDFQPHYIGKLKALGSIKMVRLHEGDRHHCEKRARDSTSLLVPFVYPGYQKGADQARSVVVFNQSAKAYREIEPAPASEKLRMMKEYVQLLITFETGFEEIRHHWQQRLEESARDDYWAGIKEKYREATRLIFSSRMEPRLVETVADHPAGEIHRLRSKPKMAASLSDRGGAGPDLSQFPGSVSGIESAGYASSHGWLSKLRGKGAESDESLSRAPRVTGEKSSKRGNGGLPVDFDPDVYLHFNPDVRTSGISAADHYLKYGHKEGRRYKFEG